MQAKIAERRVLGLLALVVLGTAAVVAALFAQKAGPAAATAADHLDAPGLTPPGGDVQRDITDLYAFRSPTNPANTVLVMNVNGVAAPGEAAPGPDRTFARGAPAVGTTKFVLYELNVDSDGDAVADVVLSTRFGAPQGDGVQELEVRSNGKLLIPKDLGRTTGFGETTPYVAEKDGVKVFAGRRDDPFFFDLVGFLNILGPGSLIGCGGASDHPERDFFASRNVSSIVLEVPSSMLTGGGDSSIGVWATTRSGGEQVDRMGRPAIATVFIPNNPLPPDRVADGKSSLKNAYNTSEPKDDQAKFRSEIVDTLTVLFSLNDATDPDTGDDAGTIQALADILLPDILTIDVSSPAGFLNGRGLADDVIDAELGIITEGLVTTDCVSANDKAFLTAFPYLASAN
ncbi:MAG TPA: DUF4331 family protein [Gaiellaceae bacterium]|nr:DUF4331 family protein [Gaiellaceae bacterium]